MFPGNLKTKRTSKAELFGAELFYPRTHPEQNKTRGQSGHRPRERIEFHFFPEIARSLDVRPGEPRRQIKSNRHAAKRANVLDIERKEQQQAGKRQNQQENTKHYFHRVSVRRISRGERAKYSRARQFSTDYFRAMTAGSAAR